MKFFFYDFKQIFFSRHILINVQNYITKIRPVGAELTQTLRTDGRTHMTKLISAFRDLHKRAS
jgi:hypothetical protein